MKWLLVLLLVPLSGCATYYKICLPGNAQCSEVRSHRKIASLVAEKCVTDAAGVKTCYGVTAEGIDSQSATITLAETIGELAGKITPKGDL